MREMLERIFLQFAEWSIPAAFMIVAILLVRGLFRRIPRQAICVLWIFVGLRLMLPISIESEFSLIPQKVVSWTKPWSATAAKEQKGAEEIVAKTGIKNATEAPKGNNAESEAGAATKHNPKERVPQAAAGTETSFVATAKLDEREPVIAEKATEKVSVAAVLSFVWLLGVIGLLGYGFVSYVKMRRRLRDAVHDTENIWLSDRIDTPFLMGVRARIYLPFSMKEQERSCVLAHERAHMARKDHITKLIGYLVLAVYWFSPFVWVAYVLMGRDIELACDERVVRTLGEQEKKNYAQVLLQRSIAPRTAKVRYVLGIPLAFGEVGVKSRIKGVLNYRKPGFWVLLCSAVLCVGLSIGFTLSPKKEETGSQSESEAANDNVTADNKAESSAAAQAARAIMADMTVQVQDETGMYVTKVIPDRMLPGSVIYFTDDTHYEVLSGAIHYDNEAKVESYRNRREKEIAKAQATGLVYEEDVRPHAGDYVFYGESGAITDIRNGLTREEADAQMLKDTGKDVIINAANRARRQLEDLKVQIPDENGLVETGYIQYQMEPGSVIYFVDPNHYVVLAGGIYCNSEERVEELKQTMLTAIDKAEADRVIHMGLEYADEYAVYYYGTEGTLAISDFADSVEEAAEYAKHWYNLVFPEKTNENSVAYEELSVSIPMELDRQPNKGYLIDLNGDGVLDRVYVGEWGIYINEVWCRIHTERDKWWLIDIDKSDGMLELLVEASGSGGGVEVYHYDGVYIPRVGYVRSMYSEQSILNPVFLEDGTIRCVELIEPLEKFLLEVQMEFDEQGYLVIVEQEYEIEQEITLTLCQELSLYAERSLKSASVLVAPQKVQLTKTDGYEWTYLVAEDGSAGWVHCDKDAYGFIRSVNGGADEHEVFDGFIPAG